MSDWDEIHRFTLVVRGVYEADQIVYMAAYLEIPGSFGRDVRKEHAIHEAEKSGRVHLAELRAKGIEPKPGVELARRTIKIRIDPETHAQLIRLAEQKHSSVNEVTNQVLARQLGRTQLHTLGVVMMLSSDRRSQRGKRKPDARKASGIWVQRMPADLYFELAAIAHRGNMSMSRATCFTLIRALERHGADL